MRLGEGERAGVGCSECVELLCDGVLLTECVCVRRPGEARAPFSSTLKSLIEIFMSLLTLKSTSSAWKVRVV